jgi:copper chaperone CopZ
METVVIGVRGMRCEGCERTVRDAVEAIPGVQAAVADLVAEEVEATCEPGRVTRGRLAAAVRAAGFAAVE